LVAVVVAVPTTAVVVAAAVLLNLLHSLQPMTNLPL
jgi:hypothetical protein